MQGLMLSKALRMQQEKEEKEFSVLQDEAAKLLKSLEEKYAKMALLKEKVENFEKNDEARKIHDADISNLKKKDDFFKELHANLKAKKRVMLLSLWKIKSYQEP
jgi:uncharacterized lipoprotein YehR (DUF1307 family)